MELTKRKQIEQVLADLYDSAFKDGAGAECGFSRGHGEDKEEQAQLKADALDEAADKILLIKELRIQPIIKRYWWPHPQYKQAVRLKSPTIHPYLPCCDWVDGYRYFRGNLEVNIQGIPIEERCRYE